MNTKPKISFFQHIDNWQDVKNATLNTIGKEKGVYPDSQWKRKLLMAEHSPIRKLKFSWRWADLPYWVSVHFVRHKIGIEHFVKTQRSDRTGTDRTELPQGTPVSHECEADAQALINISRKRLCNSASAETRAAWKLVKEEVAKVEPELASCMVPECVYRGCCPEMFGCGFANTEEYRVMRNRYLGLLSVQKIGDFYVAAYKVDPHMLGGFGEHPDMKMPEYVKFMVYDTPEEAVLCGSSTDEKMKTRQYTLEVGRDIPDVTDKSIKAAMEKRLGLLGVDRDKG